MQTGIAPIKRLGAALTFAREKQEELSLKRSKKAPGRRAQKLILIEGQHKTIPALP